MEDGSVYYMCASDCATLLFTSRSSINNYGGVGYECKQECAAGEKRLENTAVGSKTLYECVSDCPADNAANRVYYYYYGDYCVRKCQTDKQFVEANSKQCVAKCQSDSYETVSDRGE